MSTISNKLKLVFDSIMGREDTVQYNVSESLILDSDGNLHLNYADNDVRNNIQRQISEYSKVEVEDSNSIDKDSTSSSDMKLGSENTVKRTGFLSAKNHRVPSNLKSRHLTIFPSSTKSSFNNVSRAHKRPYAKKVEACESKIDGQSSLKFANEPVIATLTHRIESSEESDRLFRRLNPETYVTKVSGQPSVKSKKGHLIAATCVINSSEEVARRIRGQDTSSFEGKIVKPKLNDSENEQSIYTSLKNPSNAH